jgi:hypothetical protein
MSRSLMLLALLLVATAAQANRFELTPQIIAVANAEHSQELTLWLAPSYNTSAAETSVSFNLDQFGWVEVRPAYPGNGLNAQCTLTGGVARATLINGSGAAIPTGYAIPVCRLRVRPRSKTPRGNYYLLQSGGFAVSLDGTVRSLASSTLRVIVD